MEAESSSESQVSVSGNGRIRSCLIINHIEIGSNRQGGDTSRGDVLSSLDRILQAAFNIVKRV